MYNVLVFGENVIKWVKFGENELRRECYKMGRISLNFIEGTNYCQWRFNKKEQDKPVHYAPSSYSGS